MPFPLLRLPLLASANVIKNMDLVHIINLVQISSKARNLVKFAKTQIKLKILRSSFQFEKINNPEDKLEISFSAKSGTTESVIPFQPILNQDWRARREHEIKEYRRMMDDFVKFFNVKDVSFELKDAGTHGSYCYLEYAKSLGLQFSVVEVDLLADKEKIFQSVLSLCSDASNLFVRVLHSNMLAMNAFDGFKMDSLRLMVRYNYPDWLKVDHMCSLFNCLKVEAHQINWRGHHFNKFLKLWIASDGRIKSLSFWNRDKIKLQYVFDDIDNIQLIRNKTFEIQRADGQRAKVTIDRRLFILEVIDA